MRINSTRYSNPTIVSCNDIILNDRGRAVIKYSSEPIINNGIIEDLYICSPNLNAIFVIDNEIIGYFIVGPL